jgi:hypothetical protein
MEHKEMTTTDTPRRPLRPEELFDEALKLKARAEKAEAEAERLKLLLSDLLILTEKNYWNSSNYNQIKEKFNTTAK